MKTRLDLDDASIEALRELVVVNTDSVDGLHQAAQSVDHVGMMTLLGKLARTRDSHIEELTRYVDPAPSKVDESSNGSAPIESPANSGSTAEERWPEIHAAIRSGEPQAILREVARDADRIEAEYRKRARRTAGSVVAGILRRHSSDIRKLHGLLRRLRKASHAA